MAVRTGRVIADRANPPRPKATPATLAQVLKASGVSAGEANRLSNVSRTPAKAPTPARRRTSTRVPAQTSTGQLTPAPAQEVSPATEAAPLPAETGNPAVDQANVLASILNSPLYTESIKNAYLTQYLPGLTQANYEINRARAQEVQNSFLRQQAQAQAIRDIAGSYAARGMRTPKMVTEGFAPVQQATEMEKASAEQAINDLISGRDVLYGTGATSAETFITDPTKFGSIGAGARRTALSELMQLPEMYGLTQVAQANTSPLGGGGGTLPNGAPDLMPRVPEGGVSGSNPPAGEVPTTPLPTNTQTAAQLQARIDAANKYIRQQQAKGNQRTVAGATQKLQGFQRQLAGLGGK